MAKIKVSKSRLLEAIKTTRGRTTGICEMLDITRPTLARYVADDPEIAEAVEFAQIRRIDRAEHKLDEAVENGEAWAIALTLKDSKRGKERGFGNSVDLTTNGKDVNIGVRHIDYRTGIAEAEDGSSADSETPS